MDPASAQRSRRPARARATALTRAVWGYVRSAPGTYLWLAALFVTTIVIHRMGPNHADHFLRARSTNIHNLSTHPVRALFRSALWIDGGGWPLYALLYTVFHATVERWLGTLRWLFVVVFGHVLATYLSEGVLLWAIRHGHAPQSAVNTLDVGVSYGLAAVEAVLAYAIAAPWRLLYAGCLTLFYALALADERNFTAVGHLSAVLLGFACYPLTRGRPGRIDPAAWCRRAYRRLSRRPAGPAGPR
ncbi:rhomboid-like protein [Streptomyces sp. CA-111067]|uniref:rhomboid-like protein n=1 Tax=Streptomyces sp. CA-111067 TaxID=3240046 RepID=UPI003D96C8D9